MAAECPFWLHTPVHLKVEHAVTPTKGVECGSTPTGLWLKGQMPPVTTAMHTYHLLSQAGTHLHAPVGLEDQLMDVKDMDTEVGKSMYQLLQVSVCPVLQVGNATAYHLQSCH